MAKLEVEKEPTLASDAVVDKISFQNRCNSL